MTTGTDILPEPAAEAQQSATHCCPADAHDSIEERHGGNSAIWWACLIWAIWHYPFTICSILASANNLSVGAVAAMMVPALAGQSMSLIDMGTIYAWLNSHTGSVFL